MNEETSRSMSTPEILLVSVAALALLAGAMFVRRADSERRNIAPASIATALTRIETAKAQYATDYRLPTGSYLTLSQLQKTGYLSVSAGLPEDVHFVPGKVGENVSYHFADGSHRDHAATTR